MSERGEERREHASDMQGCLGVVNLGDCSRSRLEHAVGQVACVIDLRHGEFLDGGGLR